MVENDQHKIHYDGLQHCHSVNECPVCSLKITEHYQMAMFELFKLCADEGLIPLFVTLTVAHNKKSKLKQLIEVEKKAFDSLNAGEYAQRLKKKYGVLGYCNTFEVNHSDVNGWHPHFHVIYIIEGKRSQAQWYALNIYKKWHKKLKKMKVNTSVKGFDFKIVTTKDGFEAAMAEYMSKELAGINTKNDKNGYRKTRSMWVLLKEMTELRKSGKNQERYTYLASVWKEYTKAMYGKRFFSHSEGFSRAMKLVNALSWSEAEICEKTNVSKILYEFTLDQWKEIINKNLEAELLNWYRTEGVQGVELIMNTLKSGYELKKPVEIPQQNVEFDVNGFPINEQQINNQIDMNELRFNPEFEGETWRPSTYDCFDEKPCRVDPVQTTLFEVEPVEVERVSGVVSPWEK